MDTGNLSHLSVIYAAEAVPGQAALGTSVMPLLELSLTHGHHRAATLLLLEAVRGMREAERPAVLGAETAANDDNMLRFAGLAGYPATRTVNDAPIFGFDRITAFGYRNSLSYQIVVNWVIAEHKSQGLFQSEYGRHEMELFWLFAASGGGAMARTCQLAAELRRGEVPGPGRCPA